VVSPYAALQQLRSYSLGAHLEGVSVAHVLFASHSKRAVCHSQDKIGLNKCKICPQECTGRVTSSAKVDHLNSKYKFKCHYHCSNKLFLSWNNAAELCVQLKNKGIYIKSNTLKDKKKEVLNFILQYHPDKLKQQTDESTETIVHLLNHCIEVLNDLTNIEKVSKRNKKHENWKSRMICLKVLEFIKMSDK